MTSKPRLCALGLGWAAFDMGWGLVPPQHIVKEVSSTFSGTFFGLGEQPPWVPTRHTVTPGDTLASLAAQHGFARGACLYDHPDNAPLRESRTNPDVLAPGDVVEIPDPTPKQVHLHVDARHRFRVTRPRHSLRLHPQGPGGASLDGWRYVLVAGETRFEGVLDGPLEHPIPLGTTEATLEVLPDDENAAALVWNLEVGQLEPIETVAGVQARLNNLGFSAGAVDADEGPKTAQALRRFQAAHDLDVDGTRHDQLVETLRDTYGC